MSNIVRLLASNALEYTPKTTYRVKNREECIRKFEIKYRSDLESEDIQLSYNISDHITDIVGLRVVCLYETDIELVRKAIKDNFKVLSVTDKTKALLDSDNKFGYKGLHLDVQLKGDRSKLPEYKNFSDIQFEIQIRSIVQDAWSEVDHRLKYKKQIPETLQRRIVRLAALFELADQEFIFIRDETSKLIEKANSDASSDFSKNDEMLDAFSFLSIMKHQWPHYTFDPVSIDGFVTELLSMSKISTSSLSIMISKCSAIVEEYKEMKTAQGHRLNPFTTIRHILYLADRKSYFGALYFIQRSEFDRWLSDRQSENL